MADVKAKVKTPKKKASKREKKDWIAAYILIAPVTLGLLVFYIWPFIQNVWFSFNDVNKFNMSTFVGLANYKEMIGDKEVWRTFGNTLKYVIVTVPVGLALSTFLAALLNAKIKGKSIYRTLYFLPSATVSDRSETGTAGYDPGTVSAKPVQRVRYFPAETVLHVSAERTGRSSHCGRMRTFPYLRTDHAAADQTGYRGNVHLYHQVCME